MIDIHSHIIYGIDDGCKTLDESIQTILNLKKIGFDKLILTPHYINGSNYNKDNKEKKEKLNVLKEELLKRKIDVELFLGNEVYINDEIDELVLSKKITTLNKSRYLLIEFPLYNKVNNVDDYIYELKLKGYIIIIAHPERYEYFKENYKEVEKLYQSGVLFQCNYGSLIGKYGKEAQKLVEYLLKNNMVTFMSTDIHKPESSIIDNFSLIKDKIISIIGKDNFIKISNDNALKVINGEIIE